jgi:hypothetical protein
MVVMLVVMLDDNMAVKLAENSAVQLVEKSEQLLGQ